MDNIIEIKNLSFTYPPDANGIEKEALKDISLDIERGSFAAVIGSNGSGKSTFAKHLNGLLVPTSGTVLVNGIDTKVPETIWDVRQTVGMVFQNPDNQIVSSIVEDDVAFGPENLGVEPELIRQRVDDALESVKMGDYKMKSPHMLSGGQKQRIAIAGAVAMKPECIVFDEPTAMLDPAGRKEVVDIIRQLNEEGITAILITHFMEEAALADRIIIIDKGRVAMDGTPADVFSDDDQAEGISDDSSIESFSEEGAADGRDAGVSNIERLSELGLDIPMAVKLAHKLREHGIDVPREIVTEKELADWLADLK